MESVAASVELPVIRLNCGHSLLPAVGRQGVNIFFCLLFKGAVSIEHSVTRHRVWIGAWIYWTLTQLVTLQISSVHTAFLSYPRLHETLLRYRLHKALLRNGFQQWGRRRLSDNNLGLGLTADSSGLSSRPPYTASAWTA
jgi:hypothetical protein